MNFMRRLRDSNPRAAHATSGFQDRCNSPLCQTSEIKVNKLSIRLPVNSGRRSSQRICIFYRLLSFNTTLRPLSTDNYLFTIYLDTLGHAFNHSATPHKQGRDSNPRTRPFVMQANHSILM